MRTTLVATAFAACAASAIATPLQDYPTAPPLVSSKKLTGKVKGSNLVAKGQKLQDFAFAYPERNRVVGGKGNNDTVNYAFDTLAALNYYNVELEPFVVEYSEGNATLSVGGVEQGAQVMTYSPAGTLNKPLVAVANLGCEAADFPSTVAGNIALISRGTCPFGQKVALAGSAGAAGAVIYNNVEGPLSGTLGVPPRPEGPYVPTAGIALSNGTALLQALNANETVTADLEVYSVFENRTTYNVHATTKGGDQENILQVGAHHDSVAPGPGINDNGSGSVGILEVAVQLAKYSVKNAVRFSFWGAEEIGLLGSAYHVSQRTPEELARIRLYLNFDMIASPNFIYGVYDGDGSAFNISGPPGSAEAEALLATYLESQGTKTVSTDFDGRSDYGPFLEAGVAAGGLFTGAEGLKTPEEAALFGGEAGAAYDPNYHKVGDLLSNCNVDAWTKNTKAIAHSVATYGRSFDSLPPRNATITPRSPVMQEVSISRRTQGLFGLAKKRGAHSGCGHAPAAI